MTKKAQALEAKHQAATLMRRVHQHAISYVRCSSTRDAYLEQIKAAADEAKALGLRWQLCMYTGRPQGDPHDTLEAAMEAAAKLQFFHYWRLCK